MAKYYISPPPVSPLGRIIASILGLVFIIGAVIFGFFLLAAAAALGLLFWAGLAIRGWWLRRRKGAQKSRSQGPHETEVIEAEYTVISRRRD